MNINLPDKLISFIIIIYLLYNTIDYMPIRVSFESARVTAATNETKQIEILLNYRYV